jgi:6-pyruvoyltetrahydropterin/6-carboxytetrahydropterin synthase
LENHKGLCSNCHGHNYRFIITVERSGGRFIRNSKTNFGMVIDYKDLKEFVNKNIIEPIDHAFVYNNKDKTSVEIAEFLKKKINQKVFSLPFRITAEQLSEWIVDEFNKNIEHTEYSIICSKVELWETDSSSAVCIEDAS